MKVAVLSDIHGNRIALKKCMEEIERRGIRKLIFLGDYTGELAYPEKALAYIRELAQRFECYFVRGNKENYWIRREYDQSVTWRYGDSTTGMLLYAYSRLRPEDMEFFRSLPYVKTVSFEGLPDIAVYHGSHDKEGKKLELNTDNSHMLFEDTPEEVILCGHTHVRREVVQADRVLLNPGSVGLPLESNGLSQFLILTGEQGKWNYEFIDMPYDVEGVIRELHEEDLYAKAPYWTKITEAVLRDGRVSHGVILSRAMELLYHDTGKWSWPDIPEQYWESAFKELREE